MTVSSNAERDARIAALWPTRSSGKIATMLGCSRNAVIGIARRRGLKKAKSAVVVAAAERPERRARPAKPQKPVAIVAAPRAPAPTPVPPKSPVHDRAIVVPAEEPPAVCITDRFECLGDALLAASSQGCRWPLHDAQGHWFCGDRLARVLDHAGKVRPTAYCAEHRLASIGRGTGAERQAVSDHV